ncbi:MAG: methyltransferase domain-containing protein [Patescibacteria group bacterium]
MFSDPPHTIEQFELQSGARVADFGAGAGELSLLAARAVGESGRVYAIEVQKPLVERLLSRARDERLLNLEALWGDIERARGTHLKDGLVDAVIVSNVLFQAEDKEGLVFEAKRILKPGGKALLVDWSDSFGHTGPHPEQVIKESAARELFEKAGFRFVKKIEAGEHHYGLIFKKSV